jgi:RNA polymerase sigma-70 factor (family 1)
MEESQLWEGVKSGNLNSLNRLHVKYFHQMCLYARKSTTDTQLVEELVSDCFIKIWENRNKIEIRISIKHYLFLMLRNAIIDHYRIKQLNITGVEVFPEIADESYFDEQKQYANLYKAMEKLPEQRRKILELAVFEKLTYNEIGEKLGISRNTVKTQIGRAYRFLKETLDPKEFYLFYFFRKKNLPTSGYSLFLKK